MTLPTQNDYYDDIKIAELLDALLKRKRLILAGSFLCAFIVGLFTLLTPREYESEALILVSPTIVKNSSEGDQGMPVSNVVVSSLEASTYEVLAKSDELMLALTDTLIVSLTTTNLEKIFGDVDKNSIASKLIKDLKVELLQDTGQRNVRSTTPLLALRYKSTQKSLPPKIVNMWSELFLQRNKGLSSNVTDEFYQNVVNQYEQAKDNLERREDELKKLDAASNDLNRIKTEMAFKSVQLDTSLAIYQHLSTEKEQKTQDYEHLKYRISQIENEDEWIGYTDSVKTQEGGYVASPIASSIIQLSSEIKTLYRDSSIVTSEAERIIAELKADHNEQILRFEIKTQVKAKKAEVLFIASTLDMYKREIIECFTHIDSLKLLVSSLHQAQKEQDPVLITQKAITDNALWESVNMSGQTDLKTQQKLANYRLLSEEINPVHVEISHSIADANTQLNFLTKRSEFLQTAVDSLENSYLKLYTDLNHLRSEEQLLAKKVATEMAEAEQITRRRVSEINLRLKLKRNAFEEYETEYLLTKQRKAEIEKDLFKLEDEVSYYEANYNSWRKDLVSLAVKVDSMELERRRIERDVTVYQESFNRFAKLKEEARIARQQAAGDIQVISKAGLANPLARNTLEKVSVAALIGLILLSTYSIIYRNQPQA
jgi:hypothetical protein